MAGAFQSSAFQDSAYQTDGAATVTLAGVKHKKRHTWTVRTPSGTHVFDTEAEANRFIGAEQRRLAALRKQAAQAGVFTPKVRLEAVRTDLEPDLPPVPSAWLRVAPPVEFIAPAIDSALVVEMLARQDDEDAMALILEWL